MPLRHFYVLWILVALLGGASVFALVRVQEVQSHQNDALSALICHAEHAVKREPDITSQQRENALRFYQRQIRLEHLKGCPTP